MRGTRRISSFLTSYLGAAVQVIVLGGTGEPATKRGPRPLRHMV